jgi:hypothetical protein
MLLSFIFIKFSTKQTHMKTILFFITIIAVGNSCFAQKNIPSADVQIKSAVLAAPEDQRDSCTVYGYGSDGKLILLRQGTNELICLADDPNKPGFSVACYVKELEPFMNRGRELRAQGMNDQQVFDERGKEVKEGTLQMPSHPSALYVYSAEETDFNSTTGEVKNGYLRYVIYIPYATSASTGLPERPFGSGKGQPWIMDAGTYHAHIMINP